VQRNKRRTNSIVRFHVERSLGLTASVTAGHQLLLRQTRVHCCCSSLCVRFSSAVFKLGSVSIETRAGTYSMSSGVNHTAMFGIERLLGGSARSLRPAEHAAATRRAGGRLLDLDFGGNGRRYCRVDQRNVIIIVYLM